MELQFCTFEVRMQSAMFLPIFWFNCFSILLLLFNDRHASSFTLLRRVIFVLCCKILWIHFHQLKFGVKTTIAVQRLDMTILHNLLLSGVASIFLWSQKMLPFPFSSERLFNNTRTCTYKKIQGRVTEFCLCYHLGRIA